MENKMPLIHHVVKQWGCGYIDKDNKGLSEKDPRTLNVETQVQVNVNGMKIREGIKLG
jgi:hypothetical protein